MVTVPGSEGYMGVMAGHSPLVSTLRAGMVDVMLATAARRKVLIHINNSNPILDEASEQRRVLDSHGIEVAYDGMEITL